MSLKRQIAHNTIIHFVSKIISVLLALIAFGMMARYLDQSGFGAYTTITSFLHFFAIIADLGLTIVAIQMISEVKEDHERNFNNIFTIRLISICGLMLLAPLVSLFFPYSPSLKIGIAILSVSYIMNAAIALLTVIFQVHLRMILPLIADVIARIILIAGVAGAIYWNLGLSGVLWVITLNNIIPAVLLFLWAQRYIRIRLAFDWIVWRHILVRSWPIGLSIIFNLLYLKTDTIILSVFHSQNDVGLYGAAYQIIAVLNTFPHMFMGIMLASFARAWSASNREMFARYLQRSFDVIVMGITLIVTGTLMRASDIMAFVAGDSFSAAGPILQILIVATATVFVSAVFGNLINVVHEQRRMIIGYLIGAIVGLGGYALFIPTFSYWGAAWMTLVSEMVVLIASAWVFFQKTRLFPSLTTSAKTFFSAFVMALFLWATPNMHVLVALLLGTLLYVILLVLTGAVSRELLAEIFLPATVKVKQSPD
jgi:O-antigen/teichoic acid export membrane protein